MEIKFKAVRLDCIELGDVLLMDFESKNDGYANIRFFTSDKKYFYETTYNIGDDDIKILQYTGIKDVDGIEIYEGYIVECDDFLGVVEYRENAGVYVIGNKQLNKCIAFMDVFMNKAKVKVIGNIYENPDLLKLHN